MFRRIRFLLLPPRSPQERILRYLARDIVQSSIVQEVLYRVWRRRNEPHTRELDLQRKTSRQLKPLISVIVEARRSGRGTLRESLQSLLRQTYANWECILVVDGEKEISPIKDSRIRVLHNAHTESARRMNEALAAARGEFAGCLAAGDFLPPFSLFEFVRALNLHPESDLLYSDSDRISTGGWMRRKPFFRPSFDPEYLYGFNYLPNFFLTRRSLGEHVGWFDSTCEGLNFYDLSLRLIEKARWVTHVPGILHHSRVENPSAPQEDIRALRRHFSRRNLTAEVRADSHPVLRRVTFPIGRHPLVSIIIPNHDHASDLERCIKSVQRAGYSNFEILVVENHSTQSETFELYREIQLDPRVRVLEYQAVPFNFSEINNFAAKESNGELLLFLNNDTEPMHPEWLERLAELAVLETTGAVGAKLYFPDTTIQHAGLTLIKGAGTRHHCAHFPQTHNGYYNNLLVPHRVSAVTGACLMMRRKVFDEIGGFDPAFPINYGDIDLCMQVRQKGYQVLWTPYAELFHHESKTRGFAVSDAEQKRAAEETGLFLSKWKEVMEAGDFSSNPNLSLIAYRFLPSPARCSTAPRCVQSMGELGKPIR